MARQKTTRPSDSVPEPRTNAKRHKAGTGLSSKDDDLPSVIVDIDGSTTPEEATSALRNRVRQHLRARFHLASQMLPLKYELKDKQHELCAFRISETIVTLCTVLNLSHAVSLTALVYLQMYKNSSMSCREAKIQTASEEDSVSPSQMKRHEQFLIAAACILLAWKYREDDTRVAKSTRKIFEFASALYKVYVTQSEKCPGTPSVSGWMLQDEGSEINKLKFQLIEQESHLLQALDYHVGPVPLPHKLIPSYVRRFLIAIASDISDLHDLALKLDSLVGMLTVDCYKTQICLDYTPGEILVSCIFKATCLLTVAGLCSKIFTPSSSGTNHFNHVKDMESRLNKFLTLIGNPVTDANRVVECLADMRRYSQLFKD